MARVTGENMYNFDVTDLRNLKDSLDKVMHYEHQSALTRKWVSMGHHTNRDQIRWAIQWGQIDLLKKLLSEANINVNDVDENGRSLLELAWYHEKEAILQLLLAAGAKGDEDFRYFLVGLVRDKQNASAKELQYSYLGEKINASTTIVANRTFSLVHPPKVTISESKQNKKLLVLMTLSQDLPVTQLLLEATSTPARLQHQCVVVVRRTIEASHDMAADVNQITVPKLHAGTLHQLPLPEMMRKQLLLQEINIT